MNSEVCEKAILKIYMKTAFRYHWNDIVILIHALDFCLITAKLTENFLLQKHCEIGIIEK